MDRNVAIELLKANLSGVSADVREALETIAPELKQNEDEKARNFIIDEICALMAKESNEGGKGSDRYKELQEAMNWLENRKVYPDDDMLDEARDYISNAVGMLNSPCYMNNHSKNDVISYLKKIPAMIKSLAQKNKEDYIEWSEDDEKMFNRCVGYAVTTCPVPDKEHFVRFEKKEDKGAINWLVGMRYKVQHQAVLKSTNNDHSELEEFARIVRGNLSQIGSEVQKQFEAKYFEITGGKMYKGYKD